MTGILNFHRIAAQRGDGLHPKLLALYEQRALIAADPKLAELHDPHCVQAGPMPQPRAADFVPGNVVPMKPAAACAQASDRKTSTASS